jgi:pimeloyl-CoA dehydrogenase
MNFSLNDDHLALRDAVQRFCEGTYPFEHRGNAETPAQTGQRWSGMAELGLLGLPFAVEVGGSELGAVEVMLVGQELGRALGGGAFVSTVVMAGQLLARLGSAARSSNGCPPWPAASCRLPWRCMKKAHATTGNMCRRRPVLRRKVICSTAARPWYSKATALVWCW